jgi:hypothetical protein
MKKNKQGGDQSSSDSRILWIMIIRRVASTGIDADYKWLSATINACKYAGLFLPFLTRVKTAEAQCTPVQMMCQITTSFELQQYPVFQKSGIFLLR